MALWEAVVGMNLRRRMSEQTRYYTYSTYIVVS